LHRFWISLRSPSAPRCAASLCATAGKGSKRFDRPNRGEQRFNDDRDYPGMFHIERVGSTRREVEDATAGIWATVIDFEDNGAAVIEIGDLRERGEREPAMRSGGCYCVEELTAGGSGAHQVVPSRFSKQSDPERANQVATVARNGAASICYVLEIC
jgi:hypothetical protein